MKLTRRSSLKLLFTASIGTGAAGLYHLTSGSMEQAPERPGKVLCDLHAHPSKHSSLDQIKEKLGSHGLVGLAYKLKPRSQSLSYEMAKNLLKDSSDFKEITDGQLAKYRDGYFCRTQEIFTKKYHLLGFGWDGDDYFKDDKDPIDSVNEVHDKNGIVIFNHPSSVFWESRGSYRLPTQREKEDIFTMFNEVDEIESHNAAHTNYLRFLGINLKGSQVITSELLSRQSEHKGISASDCHDDLNQIKITGIYIDQDIIENEGIFGMKNAICSGDFEQHGNFGDGPYISNGSFTRYFILPAIPVMFSKD